MARKVDVETALYLESSGVRTAREAGMTWQAIGAVYGITKQSAAKRWPVPGK
jgi:hypothetical protein